MNQGTSGAKKTGVALLAAALLFIVVQVSEEVGQGYGKGLWAKLTGADKDPIVEQVRKTADRLNREAPRMLDSATRLDGAIQATDSMKLIVLHTLMLWRATDITEQQLQDALAARIKAAACGKESQVELLKAGFTIVYRYRSRDGMFVADIPVSHADC
jgi:hypothetical protein